MSSAEERLSQYVRQMPQPGSGKCNCYLLGAANLGVRLGLDDETILHIVGRTLVSPGPKTQRAIERAISKARFQQGESSPTSILRDNTKWSPNYPKKSTIFPTLAKWLTKNPKTVQEVISSSPIKIGANNQEATQQALGTLFLPQAIIYIGSKWGKTILPVIEWMQRPEDWGEFIIPNPLDGEEHLTKDGKPSCRCDAAVSKWLYAVAEFDNMPIELQLALWMQIKLPVVCLIHSGGKSIHAWIYVNAPPEKFDLVKQMYDDVIIPVGGDPACKNPSRLSRLPGIYRTDKQAVQQLLWLRDPKEVEVEWTSRTY